MDHLEKKIVNNRTLFDEHTADKTAIWDKIQQQLPAEQRSVKTLRLFKRMSLAASVLLVVGLTAFLAATFIPKEITPSQHVEQLLTEIDMHYQGLVTLQVERLKQHRELSEDDKNEFLHFLNELDEEYNTLKKEMEKNIDNELILEAIIANYKKRIELIENLLKQINDSKLKDEDYGYTL